MRLLPLLLVALLSSTISASKCDYQPIWSVVDPALASNSSVTVTYQPGLGYRFQPANGPAISSGGPSVTRGLIFIPDFDTASESYAPYVRRASEAGYLGLLLDNDKCRPSDEATFREAVYSVLQTTDLEYWVLAGHGEGGVLASSLVQVFHPRTKGLIVLSADPIDNSGKRLQTYLAYPSSVTITGQVDNHTLSQPLTDVGHRDFAFGRLKHGSTAPSANQNATYTLVSGNFALVLGLVHYPNIMFEVWNATRNTSAVTYVEEDQWHIFSPVNVTATAGYIFYTGGAVPELSYAVWASKVASHGYVVVLPKFALNYAPIDVFIGDRIISAYPTITKWAIGGHSLGSVSASLQVCLRAVGVAPPFLANPKIRGYIILAGVLTCNLTSSQIRVASIYGTEDIPTSGNADFRFQTLLAPRLPVFTTNNQTFPIFDRIEGGNHGFMGRYDCPSQRADGVPRVERSEQETHIIASTVKVLSNL